MIDKEILIKDLLKNIKGEFALGGESEEHARKAYEMGEAYAQTKRFDNSRFYRNYQFTLNDGARVSSSSFFNQFMSRNQTGAYMDAEKALRPFIEDDKQVVFRMVRDKRIGINGVFKAVMSPGEPQQLNYTDFVLVIACFCAGVVNQ